MRILEWRVDPVPSSVPAVRRQVRADLVALGVPEEAVHAVLLVLSELLTNGVIHDGAEQIVIRLEVKNSAVAFTVVTAEGADRPEPAGMRSDPEETGRGLPIVAAVADDVAIDLTEDRRATSGHIPLQAHRTDPSAGSTRSSS